MSDFIEPSNTDLAQCPESVQDYIADLEMGLDQCVKREKQYADRYWENRWRDEALHWQPIETAPINEHVLLYCPDRGCPTNRERIELGCASSGWVRGNIQNISHHSWATHWMPLPKPPKECLPECGTPNRYNDGGDND